MINLFEYQNKVDFPQGHEGLELFLDEIWNNRETNGYYFSDDPLVEKNKSQRFLQFLRKTKEVKSNKYVGVILFEDQKINLLPKIFYEGEREYSEQEIGGMHQHILWWLSYCRKIKFPNYQTTLGSAKSDFFEVLIYLFSKYTRELLSNSIYQQYEEIREELPHIKGRLNTQAYITENVARGQWQKLQCTYDAFVFDNKFNRIIKYVTNILFHATAEQQNKKHLREILFILDDVSDEPATAAECANIQFNPLFAEFETVRDYCYLFLNNSVSFDYKNKLKLFAFLLPMEYLFEDFVFGFINKEIPEINAKAQVGNTHLDVAETFALKPDLMLDLGHKKIIADCKYKIIYSDSIDPKKGISQPDLYQMVAYAIRFKISEIVLFYPNTVQTEELQKMELIIPDELAGGQQILIRAYQIPIVNFLEKYPQNEDWNEKFRSSKVTLKEHLKSVLL